MSRKMKTTPAPADATMAAKSEKGRVLKRMPRAKKAAAEAEPKKPLAKKEPKAARAETPSVAGSLAALRESFCASLLRKGKSEGTARSYAADLIVAEKHFGADKLVAKISKAEAQGYIDSDRVNLDRAGQRKNQITIDKVVRVFRQAIDFAVAEGWLKTSPLPAYERKGRKSKEAATGDAEKESSDAQG